MKLKIKNGDGEMFNVEITAETYLRIWRFWRIVMFTNRRPYVNIILSHLTEQEIPGLEEIKKACKSHRIERIEKNESEAVIELKRKQNQGSGKQSTAQI